MNTGNYFSVSLAMNIDRNLQRSTRLNHVDIANRYARAELESLFSVISVEANTGSNKSDPWLLVGGTSATFESYDFEMTCKITPRLLYHVKPISSQLFTSFAGLFTFLLLWPYFRETTRQLDLNLSGISGLLKHRPKHL